MNNSEIKGVTQPKTKLGKSKMDKILKAARKLFSKNGFYQTSITDICRESNTAVGTFYIYFDDKTALYRCLMEDVQREIKDTINEALLKKNCTTRLEKEKEGLRAFVKYGAANHDMFEILWGSLTVDKSLFVDYYRSFGASYIRSLSYDRQELADYVDVDSAAYLFMGINSFLALRTMIKPDLSDEEIDHMIDQHVVPILKKAFSALTRKTTFSQAADLCLKIKFPSPFFAPEVGGFLLPVFAFRPRLTGHFFA